MGGVITTIILRSAASGNADAADLTHRIAACTLRHKMPENPMCGRLTHAECAKVLDTLASTGNSTDDPTAFLAMVHADLQMYPSLSAWEADPRNAVAARDGLGVTMEYAFGRHLARAT